ncbi:TRPT1 [Symbiodinium sp. CCMP2592]|nr:TRPT1 [Symbiodinium sp. CCMP2592]
MPPAGRGGRRHQRDVRDDRDDEEEDDQEPEEEDRPRRYPRSRYRPDGTRRRSAGELQARQAAWQNKRKGRGQAPQTGQGKGKGKNSDRGKGNGEQPRQRPPTQTSNRQQEQRQQDRRTERREDQDPRPTQRRDQDDDRSRDREWNPDTWQGGGWIDYSSRQWDGWRTNTEDRRPDRRRQQDAEESREGRRPPARGTARDDRDTAPTSRADRQRDTRDDAPQRRVERHKDTHEDTPPRRVERREARTQGRPPTPPRSPRKRGHRGDADSRPQAENSLPKDLPRGPPQSTAQTARQWERWQSLRDNLRKLRQNGATEHIESFFGRGHYTKKHDDFHKAVKLPSYGNWNWASFAYLLCGELHGNPETSKEGSYGAAVEGWVGTVHEEEDPEFRAMFNWIVESMDAWVDLLSEITSQMHDIMGWKITEPEVDRLLRHFYPGAKQPTTAPSSSSHQAKEVPYSAPSQDADYQDEEDDYYYEDEEYYDEGDEEEEEDQYWEREEEAPASSHKENIKDEHNLESLEALGIYEEVPTTPAPNADSAHTSAHSTLTEEPEGSLEQAPTFTPYSFPFPPTRLRRDRDETLSKRLSKVLRHDKGQFGLDFYKNATEELMAVIYWNKKQRFRILLARDRDSTNIVVGAVQGHSSKVDPEAVHDRVDPKEVPFLLHATHYEFYKKIFHEGLHPGGGGGSSWRQQLHLLPGERSSERYFPTRTDIVLHVKPSSATECVYYRSQNGYYLTSDSIAPKYIQAVTIRESGERVESTEDSPPLPSVVLQAYLRPQLGQAGRQSELDGGQTHMLDGQAGILEVATRLDALLFATRLSMQSAADQEGLWPNKSHGPPSDRTAHCSMSSDSDFWEALDDEFPDVECDSDDLLDETPPPGVTQAVQPDPPYRPVFPGTPVQNVLALVKRSSPGQKGEDGPAHRTVVPTGRPQKAATSSQVDGNRKRKRRPSQRPDLPEQPEDGPEQAGGAASHSTRMHLLFGEPIHLTGNQPDSGNAETTDRPATITDDLPMELSADYRLEDDIDLTLIPAPIQGVPTT